MFPFRGKAFRSDTLRQIFRALKYRNYRYYYFGQSISLIGTWVQNIAMGWLVYRLTGSALLLGTIAFALQIPSLFITPFAGVLADRWNRKKTIIISQTLSMAVAFVLAALVLSDTITVGWIIALALANGVVLAFDTPFRQSFVPDIITRREDLSNAIALNSSLYNMARFVGPPIGGLLIALVGEGWCFFINGVSFLSVIIGLLAMRIGHTKPAHRFGSLFAQLKEGIGYAWGFHSLRYLITLVALSSFFGLPFQALMPLFAAEILGGDAQMLGWLTGALGAGALTGAFYLAAQSNILKVPKTTFQTSLLFSGGLAIFALSPFTALSLAALVLTGFGMIVHFNATNTLLQSIADEDKRGRVVSLYSLTFMGITPLGSLLAGFIAEYIGVPYTVFAFSLICLASALLFGHRVRLIFFSLVRRNKTLQTENP
ncbi:MAG: MFS transporter [Bacteroidales bacterium]